jgi:hypothetical protein
VSSTRLARRLPSCFRPRTGPGPDTPDGPLFADHYPQNNARIKKWNDLVTALLSKEASLAEAVFQVEVYDTATEDFEHSDNVHMKRPYYSAIADLFKDKG